MIPCLHLRKFKRDSELDSLAVAIPQMVEFVFFVPFEFAAASSSGTRSLELVFRIPHLLPRIPWPNNRAGANHGWRVLFFASGFCFHKVAVPWWLIAEPLGSIARDVLAAQQSKFKSMKKIQVIGLFGAGFVVGALTVGLWLGGIGRH